METESPVINRYNLRRMAAYLYHLADLENRGIHLPVKFDMNNWGDNSATYDWYENTTCGTVGCVVGHATLAIEPKISNERWCVYCKRMFGVSFGDPAFQWLFDSEWAMRDNSILGAAKRIDWFLEHGLPPDVRGQMLNHKPLCYYDHQPSE